jgi:hypothetical protein
MQEHATPQQHRPVPPGHGGTPAAPGAIAIAEEAFHLVRRTAWDTLPLYYIGSAPFVCAAVFVWAELVRSPFATEQTVAAAFALTLLYLWMKTWQALYAQRLYRLAAKDQAERLGTAAVARMAVRQGFVQSIGLLLLPVALAMALPFGWVYAFMQSYGVVEDGRAPRFRDGCARAWTASHRWPGQNHLLIWIYSPYVLMVLAVFYLGIGPALMLLIPEFAEELINSYLAAFVLLSLPMCPVGGIIALNIAGGIYVIPYLMQTLFGVRSVISDGAINFGNSTMVAVVCGLTYLCLDPMMKAAYALRCFHGDAVSTGEDLRIALRRAIARAAGVVVVLSLAGGAWAQEVPARERAATENTALEGAPAVSPAPAQAAAAAAAVRLSPADINAALDEELSESRYIWRTKPVHPLDTSESAIARFIRSVAEFSRKVTKKCGELVEWVWDKLEALWDWLFPERKKKSGGDGDALGAMTGLRLATTLLIAALVVLIVFLGWRVWVARQQAQAEAMESAVVIAAPDLEDEATSAADLPEDEWLRMARELAEKGDYRLAARAYFLATLAVLAARNLIRIVRSKSNMDYARELARYAHEAPHLRERFAESMGAYEAVWYGSHPSSADLCARLEENWRGLAGHG